LTSAILVWQNKFISDNLKHSIFSEIKKYVYLYVMVCLARPSVDSPFQAQHYNTGKQTIQSMRAFARNTGSAQIPTVRKCSEQEQSNKLNFVQEIM